MASSFLNAIPSAELIPIGADNAVQSDEVEMGMTYDELSVFGRLRKVEKCGPYSMFGKLAQEWGSFLSPAEVSVVKRDSADEVRSQRRSSTSSSPTPSTDTRCEWSWEPALMAQDHHHPLCAYGEQIFGQGIVN